MNALILVLAATLSLDTVIDNAERAGADGVLFVRRGDTVLYERAFGNATTKQLFDIGSITKVMTAVAAAQTMPLDLRVGDVFPDAPADKAAITVEQLLTHKSGLPESIGLDETLIKRPFFLAKLFKAPVGEPQYSDPGYTLLAAMLEVRTGQSYPSYMRKHVFEHTYVRREPLANGTLNGMSWGSSADYAFPDGVPSWYLLGAGGIIASTRELDSWFNALWTGKLLTKEGTEKFRDRLTRRDKSGRAIQIVTGNNLVFSSVYERWPDSDTVFILFTNDSAWTYEKLLPQVRPAVIELAEKR